MVAVALYQMLALVASPAVTTASWRSCFALLFPLLFVASFTLAAVAGGVPGAGNGVFSVKYRYAGMERTLSDLKAHDVRRQLQILAGVDLPLGGTGRPNGVGLYYAKIGIGTPSNDYYVQVDTGSDIMWVNCIQCKECPKTSSLGIDLTLYDINESASGTLVTCDQEFCSEVNGGPLSGCTANVTCPYLEIYGDGSSTAGYFVKDAVQYDRVSGDLETASANGSVIFGCGARQSGDLGSSTEAALGVKKIFAHCLDGENGGGIFAIGHVVEPRVNMTPIIQDQPHYNVNMTAVQVGHDMLNLPAEVFDAGDKKGAIIDSGTTLAYLPEMVYKPLVTKIISEQPNLRVQTVHDEYTCFQYSGSLDDAFPNVTFHFENSLLLRVYPHEYLFPFVSIPLCSFWFFFISQSKYSTNCHVLADLVLSNKLVLYDLEKQAIGWTEYNCESLSHQMPHLSVV
ncbi:unnamed protein product [Linum tenue]|uniref:Peptidase A1 domain-containing protein n=1 Tax=Linum tenue TaxID=586396 RepID=A0AAV0IJR0_9ROSI|nr:unnamed protein product [Linum tenue]